MPITKSSLNALLLWNEAALLLPEILQRIPCWPSLSFSDLETRVLEPLENPFGPKVLPMS